ncbi:hypothetical protein BFP72_16780 [Reichenbachiella sp. 5M10]|uniref:RDD family protein n=1 Tax=Reichenbachiella sp. 5M10 TaxID=1889772 RepID=UPI000C154AF8|nr:RDD family protein [Reichenbachiella sp. 5M10]PIB36940.1 hypothetical protein BFP72_16780 [Reichenbachiella sp. 5M10]
MSHIGVYTAQNIFINFKIAGIGDRIAAFLIDLLILTAYAMFISFVLSTTESFGIGSVLYLPILFYHPLFEYLMNGQSPGKKQMKIRVLKEEGEPVTISSILLRWVLSPIDFMMSGGIAISSIILTKQGQRLGDLAGGTIVVKEKKLENYDKAFIRHQVEEGYEPVFPAVKVRLEQKDIDLIQDVLRVRLEHTLNAPAEKIRAVMEKKLEINSDRSTVNFLHTLVKDFNYYQSQEEAYNIV